MKKATDRKMKPTARRASARDATASAKPARKLPSDLRRGPVAASELKDAVAFLSERAAELQAIIDKMQKLAISQLDEVDGVTKLARGSTLIAEFTGNLYRALVNESMRK